MLQVISITKKRACIRCASHDLKRIPRTPLGRIVSIFMQVKQYRCRNCEKNMLLWQSEDE